MYGSGDSLLVTHATTDPPIGALYMGERTGTLTLCHLWPYMRGESVRIEYVQTIFNRTLEALQKSREEWYSWGREAADLIRYKRREHVKILPVFTSIEIPW